VVTTGGIYGTVIGLNDREDTIVLKIADNVKIEIQRQGISGLRKPAHVIPADPLPK
jgi:preprotein translocase subunit YajC